MSGKRQKTQYTQLRLALAEESRGETLGANGQGTEPLTAKRNSRKPGRGRTADGGGVRAKESRNSVETRP